MYPRRRVVKQALRLGLLVMLLVLALIACEGGVGEAGSQEDEAEARPLPENNVSLRPGEYRSVAFEPSFSFRVGEGWKHVAPEDMAAWLRANPHLKPDEPKPVSVGGEKGVRFDAIVTGAVETPLCPGCVDLPLFRYSDGETAGVEKGEKIRFIVMEDVKGKTVTIFVETTPQAFEEFLPKAQKVVDSVKWGGS
jgi:hypothetical protein